MANGHLTAVTTADGYLHMSRQLRNISELSGLLMATWHMSGRLLNSSQLSGLTEGHLTGVRTAAEQLTAVRTHRGPPDRCPDGCWTADSCQDSQRATWQVSGQLVNTSQLSVPTPDGHLIGVRTAAKQLTAVRTAPDYSTKVVLCGSCERQGSYCWPAPPGCGWDGASVLLPQLRRQKLFSHPI
jgi:hypothetical protein